MKKLLLSLSLFAAVFSAFSLTSNFAQAGDTVVVGQRPYGYGYGYGYGYPYAGYVPYPGPYAGYVPYPGPYAGFVPGAVPPIGPGYYSPNPALQQPYNSASNPFYLYDQAQRVQAGRQPFYPVNPVNTDNYY